MGNGLRSRANGHKEALTCLYTKLMSKVTTAKLTEMNIMAMINHQNVTLIPFANAILLQFKSSLSARNSQSTRKIIKHVLHVLLRGLYAQKVLHSVAR